MQEQADINPYKEFLTSGHILMLYLKYICNKQNAQPWGILAGGGYACTQGIQIIISFFYILKKGMFLV